MNKRRIGIVLAILIGLYFAGASTTLTRPCEEPHSAEERSAAGCVEFVDVGDDPSILLNDGDIAREFIFKFMLTSSAGVLLAYLFTRKP